MAFWEEGVPVAAIVEAVVALLEDESALSPSSGIGQLVFKGVKRLNRIQSIVFETAYNTNENLLICAPTGAGKTNIAMLTVLHEIRQHLQPGGLIRKDEFKIVYVAPMKALAAEMTNYFSKRLEPLGIAVRELTGDMQLTKGEIQRTQSSEKENDRCPPSRRSVFRPARPDQHGRFGKQVWRNNQVVLSCRAKVCLEDTPQDRGPPQEAPAEGKTRLPRRNLLKDGWINEEKKRSEDREKGSDGCCSLRSDRHSPSCSLIGECSPTPMLVTTPEKWDVVTRKSVGDVALSQMVRLLILDEVHLLHEDRGPVLESLVARTLRQERVPSSAVRKAKACTPRTPGRWQRSSVELERDAGGVHPEHDPHPGPLGHPAQLPGRGHFPSRQPLHRPLLLRRPLQTRAPRTDLRGRQNHQQGKGPFPGPQSCRFTRSQCLRVSCSGPAAPRHGRGLLQQGSGAGQSWTPGDGVCARPERHRQDGHGAGGDGQEPRRSLLLPAGPGPRLRPPPPAPPSPGAALQKQADEGDLPRSFGIHHAGMLRSDRSLMESLFSRGHVKVLVCTATLAWGVNLPAHAVIIKVLIHADGTEIYDAKRGALVDLGILDVMQIFGRAGRPQFDKCGQGTIITSHDKLSYYLTLLTQQNPIESQFLGSLADNLNAEVALGSVTNVEEAVKWLSYTYLYVRMRANPLAYGINHRVYQMDPALELYRKELVVETARKLDKARMIRFQERTGYLASTDLGRTASHFYIRYNTMETFNENLNSQQTEAEILNTVSKAEEFEQLKVRDEELEELDQLLSSYCLLPAAGGVENSYGKINILLQTYISRGEVDSFSLVSDLSYVAQNAARIVRALFEMALRKRWPTLTYRLLTLCKVIDRRLWASAHPLRQFPSLSHVTLNRLEEKRLSLERLKEMRKDEIGHMLHHVSVGSTVKQCLHQIPAVALEASVQPITRTVLRVRLLVSPDFRWNDQVSGRHGDQRPPPPPPPPLLLLRWSGVSRRRVLAQVHGGVGEPWWLWVEDPLNDHIYHSEYLLLQKRQVVTGEAQNVVFTIPIFEPLPSQYYIRVVSDRWLGAEAVCVINFQNLILPERHPPHTGRHTPSRCVRLSRGQAAPPPPPPPAPPQLGAPPGWGLHALSSSSSSELLDLQPLPVTALGSHQFESLYRFTHFNPIQTQIFHTLYHSDTNVLLGAPTGSGKTIAAELAMFRVFNQYPASKVGPWGPAGTGQAQEAEPLQRVSLCSGGLHRPPEGAGQGEDGGLEGQDGGEAGKEVRQDAPPWEHRSQPSGASLTLTLSCLQGGGADRRRDSRHEGHRSGGPHRHHAREVGRGEQKLAEPQLRPEGVHPDHRRNPPPRGGQRSRAGGDRVQDQLYLLPHLQGGAGGGAVHGAGQRPGPGRLVGDQTGQVESLQLPPLGPARPPGGPHPGVPGAALLPPHGQHEQANLPGHTQPLPRQARADLRVVAAADAADGPGPDRLPGLGGQPQAVAAPPGEPGMRSQGRAGSSEGGWPQLCVQIEDVISTVRDSNLKLTLAFGIGMHHAGLHERDRKVVEELFVNCKIQVLVATSTLAWGVNFPAHLVVVKGTEYYDGKSRRYVDYPITDVLQMMGRAGRPQFDDQGKAVILVQRHQEGLLQEVPDAMDYITWTYFFRRLVMNPSYYSLEDISHESINRYLSSLVERSLRDLECSYCIEIQEDERTIQPLTYGRISSYYYLKHQSIRTFKERLKPEMSVQELLTTLAV
ncbi:unnamed protein product, partial [Tetraodon nigroviridis]